MNRRSAPAFVAEKTIIDEQIVTGQLRRRDLCPQVGGRLPQIRARISSAFRSGRGFSPRHPMIAPNVPIVTAIPIWSV